jgi:hypothetical protein
MTAERPVRRLLTPAARIRVDAIRIRDRLAGLNLEAYAIGAGREHTIAERLSRSIERIEILVAELEQIADDLEPAEAEPVPAPPGYSFGVRELER